MQSYTRYCSLIVDRWYYDYKYRHLKPMRHKSNNRNSRCNGKMQLKLSICDVNGFLILFFFCLCAHRNEQKQLKRRTFLLNVEQLIFTLVFPDFFLLPSFKRLPGANCPWWTTMELKLSHCLWLLRLEQKKNLNLLIASS